MNNNESLINSAIKSLEKKLFFARKNGFLLRKVDDVSNYYKPNELVLLIRQNRFPLDIDEEKNGL